MKEKRIKKYLVLKLLNDMYFTSVILI